MKLLSDLDAVRMDALPVGDPLPPVSPLPQKRAATLAVDEPLLTVDDLPAVDAYARLGLLPPRTLRLRGEVARRLREARSNLPRGFDLCILDGWRSMDEQKALLAHYASLGPTTGFVAAVDPDAIRPPHTTGGAVDLTLLWDGCLLALGTEFDDFTDTARLHAFEAEDTKVRRLRRLLAGALAGAGLCGYELEWWHWSYGDDVWAAAQGRDALYDVIPTLDRHRA